MPNKVFVSKEGLTKSQIIAIMKYYLAGFNDENVQISEQTVHNEVLSDTDGVTSATSSKRLYKGLVNFALDKNGHGMPKWPEDWIELTVDELATKFAQ